MSSRIQVLIPSSLLLLILAYMSVFYVREHEKAILFRLGEMVSADYKPGLHFKTPIINNVSTFDARVLTLDAKSERFLTSEKKNVIVDSFAKWRIGDVGLFYTTVGGDEFQANLRLDQIMKDAMRSEFGVRTIKQLISEDRSELRNTLLQKLAPTAAKFGIELIDIRVKRIDLPPEVSSSVYQRMRAERERVAREFRSQGAESAEQISAEADKQRQVIVANAQRDAENIRGRGDAGSAEIYAKSFGRNPEFYAFYRSLQAYQTSFEKTQDTLVLKPDSDFFKYFSSEK
ncbi:protease modulator HflC [Methylomonas sp. MED-D]|uniref:Protein HflC n=1 Tax=Methylomonas koyamae TaxID=702114 RepID=A0A177NCL1_9GAMM|nr:MULTISPECIES: protease modulator HflC [Methylomonas]NJA04869.1 protease modulator HflC [Methylococcaceae bacterium WWC4]MDT4329014.1 protease modulator HflC [Methylomonas sp. MV1]OAI14949.1 protease modulator HflC [Methylomonas koyamae]OHX35279.1 HflC protein [Methylomonas sp. LWB]WGS87773.1 protease modulator HflC [Methylomonas sp. UP202]